jgi:hypothetical protein
LRPEEAAAWKKGQSAGKGQGLSTTESVKKVYVFAK